MKKYRIKLFTFSTRHIANSTFKNVAGGQEGFRTTDGVKIAEYTSINQAHSDAEYFVKSGNFERATVEEVP